MPPPWKRLWGGTRGAAETLATRMTRGAVRRDYWDQSISFIHYSDQTVVMGVYDCGAAGGDREE